MKKFICLLLLFSFLFCFVSCQEDVAVKELSCDDIIKAYEEAGYFVTHGNHQNEADSSQCCYIKASLTENADSDYIYFITCFTEQQAEECRKIDDYNLAVWFLALLNGESRWLKSGTYGTIEYSYYNSELFEPFEKLISDGT